MGPVSLLLPRPPTRQVMDQHVHSLAEAVIATSAEGAENSFIVPIIDVLDEARHHPLGHAQHTHTKAFR